MWLEPRSDRCLSPKRIPSQVLGEGFGHDSGERRVPAYPCREHRRGNESSKSCPEAGLGFTLLSQSIGVILTICRRRCVPSFLGSGNTSSRMGSGKLLDRKANEKRR